MSRRGPYLRLFLQWLIAVLLGAVLIALFVVIGFVQLTSEETGTRVHRRAIAALTDTDAVLPGIEAALDDADADPQAGTVLVPDFPVPVRLTADEARTLRGAALRDRILDEASATLYDDGMSAWAATDERAQRIEPVSAAGAVKAGLGLARDSKHNLFLWGAALLTVVAALLAGALLLAVRDWNLRFVSLGTVVFAAALPCLAAAIALRFAFKTAQTDADPFVDELLDLGIDAMWVPIRDYSILSILGFAVAGLGAAGAWLQGRSQPRVVHAIPRGE